MRPVLRALSFSLMSCHLMAAENSSQNEDREKEAFEPYYFSLPIPLEEWSDYKEDEQARPFNCGCKIMQDEATLEKENLFFMGDSMGDLSKQKCVPCSAGGTPLKGQAIADLARQLDPAWKAINEHHLEREYTFKNFRQALDFTNKIGEIAEEQGHHPDILLSWGKVKVTFWTHKINGLSESDFIMAAKCEACYPIK